MAIPTTLNNRVVSTCSGCTQAAVDMEFLATLRAFCALTGVWQYTDTQNLTTATAYTLTPPVGADISGIDTVHVATIGYSPWSEASRGVTQPDRTFNFLPDQTGLAISPAPANAVASGLVVTARVMPQTILAVMPARVFTQHEEAIYAGVLSRMFLTPNRGYTNPRLSALYSQKFSGACAAARRQVLTNYSSASVSWKFPMAERSIKHRS